LAARAVAAARRAAIACRAIDRKARTILHICGFSRRRELPMPDDAVETASSSIAEDATLALTPIITATTAYAGSEAVCASLLWENSEVSFSTMRSYPNEK
jgi:hypothetical protein